MAADLRRLQESMESLEPADQLRLAQCLLAQALAHLPSDEGQDAASLLALAGRYEGGPGDSAERTREILLA